MRDRKLLVMLIASGIWLILEGCLVYSALHGPRSAPQLYEPGRMAPGACVAQCRQIHFRTVQYTPSTGSCRCWTETD